MDVQSLTVRNGRLTQYGIPIGMIVVLAVLLFFIGDPLNLILVKLTAVPLFFLAGRGLDLIFSSEASRTPWTAVFLERQILDAFIFICFMTIFLWQPDVSALRLATIFIVGVVCMSVMKILVESITRRRSDKPTR
ncbi:hypothetical protein [Mesorhizobium sp. ZC-5]|uniref:hypothetical protein n=1 Tax=Mesorhizobium sp. ZC-5 TaxID=2986066 RepID=UPI0021E97CDF|nr:hypothetical protein [Mesorhizobium sp. ZC-5]MCV3239449.1 hypothetical protein [Mesorhizobium sp. ZC-5]